MAVMVIARPDSIDTRSTPSISFPPPTSAVEGRGERREERPRKSTASLGRSSSRGPNHIPGRVVQPLPIQQAKVQRPPLRAATLRRPRLIQWLEENLHRRVILVTAEAGYGKTTLLADFARGTKQRILWYRIDEDDSNWVTFTQHVVAAGREVDRTFAPNTVELLADASAKGRTTSGVLGAFLSELNGLVSATPTALILDDYHLVDGVPEIREFMKGLVARAPVGLTLIIAGRRTPSVPLSRLRAMGEVAELRSDDLRFQPAEPDRLVRETYRREIEADIVEDVARRTEGLAASLQLVDAALVGRT